MGIDPMNALWVTFNGRTIRVWEIAGVMKDFNFGTLHKDRKLYALDKS
jgi:hypothetical protein